MVLEASRPSPCWASRKREAGNHFDDNWLPAGKGRVEMALPLVHDEHAYALEISDDQLRPIYRDGDIIVVSSGNVRSGVAIVWW